MITRIVAALCALTAVSAQAQPQLPAWRLDPAPMLSLVDDGTPAREFNRIGTAWRLPNGNVVVANVGSSELRTFDSKGALVNTFGRKGKGPGEFERFDVVDVRGDTAILWDAPTMRLTTIVFGAKPEARAMLTVTASGGKRFDVSGRLSDGRWIVGTTNSPRFDGPKEVWRLEAAIGVVAPKGDGTVDWLVDLPGMAVFSHIPGGDIKKGRTGPAAFSPWYYSAASGPVLWFGESGSDSLVRYEVGGARRRIALPFPAVAPSATLVARASGPEMERAQRTGSEEFTAAKWSAANLPPKLPYFSALIAGMGGELWVREYAPLPATPTRHLVLNAQGVPIAWVPVPAGIRVTDIGRDYVVGIARDADDLEIVKVFRLTRSGR